MHLEFAKTTSIGGPQYGEGCIRFFLLVKPELLVCPECGSREVSRKGRRFRELQTVPIGRKPVFLATEVPKSERRISPTANIEEKQHWPEPSGCTAAGGIGATTAWILVPRRARPR